MGNSYSLIRVDRQGPVAEVVLDNPKKLNTMAPAFFEEIRHAFREIDTDERVRVVLLWAEGRLFSAGLDLKAAMDSLRPANGSEDTSSEALRNLDMYHRIKDLQDCFTSLASCRKPVIAAIHGKCIGGGIDLITAADIRLCSAEASFSIYETRIAIVADVGTLQRITPIVGKGMAREMALTGEFIDAERALACGLVNAVYADKEKLLTAGREMAAEISQNSPLSVQGTKVVLNFADEHPTAEGLEYVAQWNSSFLRSRDVVEAVTAFIEKRPARFKGN